MVSLVATIPCARHRALEVYVLSHVIRDILREAFHLLWFATRLTLLMEAVADGAAVILMDVPLMVAEAVEVAVRVRHAAMRL